VTQARQVKAGRHVAVYWDGQITLEVGVELLGPFDGYADVVRSDTPAGMTASTTHFGPYNTLGAAHQAICQWCDAQGVQRAGPSWEIYGHWQREWDQDASRIRTDVFYLID
jgi:effector-binding domain-containing protein